MSTAIRHPVKLSPAELDQYLARGWRPSGQSLYTCDYVQLEPGEIVSVLPTRLNLQHHQFGKRMRKLLRRNRRIFRVEVNPVAQVSVAKRRVNQLYQLENPEKTLTALEFHLQNNRRTRVLNTWETQIFHRDRLVAFSFFDLGEKAAYSKAGIYDPGYRRYSLGLFTLLLEVEACRERGMHYFYPGYIAPEDPIFDYKHRIGELEFWNLSNCRWQPFSSFDPACHDPLRRSCERLDDLQQLVQQQGGTARFYQYPHLDQRFMVEGPSPLLDAPVLLHLRQTGPFTHRIVIYDAAGGLFRGLEASETGGFPYDRIGTNSRGWSNFVTALNVRQQLFATEDLEQAAALCSQLTG